MDTKDFMPMARALVARYVNHQTDSRYIKLEDVFVVWVSKTIQNDKALLSTITDGDERFYAITYNGDKQEVYFDCYDKVENIVYTANKLKEIGCLQ